MLKVYKILRFLIVTLIMLVTVVPVGVFVALSLPQVQRAIDNSVERNLSDFLGVDVTIGDLGIIPFNRVALRNVLLATHEGDTIAKIEKIGVGVSLYSLVASDHVSVNYLELIGMDVRINKASDDAPLNIAPILQALAPSDTTKEPTPFDFRVNTIVVRRSQVRYDILSEPVADRFDPHHLALANLRADLRLPLMRNNDFTIDLKRLSFEERSGLTLSNLAGRFHVADSIIGSRDFALLMPGSELHFADFDLPLKSLKQIGEALQSERVELRITEGSHLAVADFAAFLPPLAGCDDTFDIAADIVGNLRQVDVRQLSLATPDRLTSLSLAGEIDSPTEGDAALIDVEQLRVSVAGRKSADYASLFAALPPQAVAALTAAETVQLNAAYRGTLRGGDLKATLTSAIGSIDLKAVASLPAPSATSANVDLQISDANLGTILGDQQLGILTAQVRADVSRRGKLFTGPVELDVDAVGFKGNTYRDLQAKLMLDGERADLQARIDDPLLGFFVNATILPDPDAPERSKLRLHSSLSRMNLEKMGLSEKYPGYNLKGRLDASLSATNIDDVTGRIFVNDLEFAHPDQPGIEIYRITLDAQADSARRTVTLNSDVVDGRVDGQFAISTLPATVVDIFSHVYPVVGSDNTHAKLASLHKKHHTAPNELSFAFTVKETERYQDFLQWPVRILYPVEIEGSISETQHVATLSVDAPYLRQQKKLIEKSSLHALVDGENHRASLNIATTYPTKNGPMALTIDNKGSLNTVDTNVSWKIDREQAYEGELGLTTTFSRSEAVDIDANEIHPLVTTVDIHRSHLVFNDATWTVNPARVAYIDRWLSVDGIDVNRDNQYVKISGTASANPYDVLRLSLLNVNLDYIFDTLGIDKVMLGGDATGEFEASQLFTSEPHIETSGLDVKHISYNREVFGDATIKSHWDTESRGITLDAVITDPEGRLSEINGAIYPLSESLDLTFDVDRAPVGFLNPYMEAFAADVSGYASGRLRLFGTFKYVDMEGDVFADDVNMRIRFTNTRYWATDSLHLRPGLIALDGITIRDEEGHKARLGGWVRHKFFKEPSFDISLTDASNFLSYKETPKENPMWHGRIYGNGSAFVRGWPGVVNIDVDMATAPRSTFTFVLSDMEEAGEYSFLTFRDVTRVEVADTLEEEANPLYLVNRFRLAMDEHEQDLPSAYNINLQMRITPEAQINLVMDPIAGDRIRTRGNGHLRLEYGSSNNDLKMFGTYTVDNGDYNFTLQDIIVKDFKINEGGKITFNGDPYAAQLDLRAAYTLNTNLSDLDESFPQENVPVHALMIVNGDIRQPEISFDLEFPTLTQDTYRKVRSIVSTDDMMNRQIIYLLALNRFYTPDYMSSSARSNEMMSLASSTISSQLGSMLGQLSDNWSIAPNFRSGRGDFSDMEFNLALSSRLLNNRLLFNGNFGYRDNALNTTQFIGDFDLEYLLNRSGNVRLKAYNRYNDQNYFLRTANTTQGVGIMYKRDFDNIFGFLRRHRPAPKSEE